MVIRTSVKILGPTPFYGYQDGYFAGSWKPDPRTGDFFGQETIRDLDFLEFYRARNFHLWGRLANARAGYQRLIDHPNAWTDDALLFLGRSYLDGGAPASALEPLSRLRSEFPRSIWYEPATYWLARAYEQQGQMQRARELYHEVKQVQGLEASVRLLELDATVAEQKRVSMDSTSATP